MKMLDVDYMKLLDKGYRQVKMCVFLSLFLKRPLNITLSNINRIFGENFLETKDIFSRQMKKSDV